MLRAFVNRSTESVTSGDILRFLSKFLSSLSGFLNGNGYIVAIGSGPLQGWPKVNMIASHISGGRASRRGAPLSVISTVGN